MKQPIEIWEMCSKILKENITTVTFTAWFDDTQAINFENNTLYLYVSSEFKREMIEKRFIPYVKKALKELFFEDIDVSFSCDKQYPLLDSSDINGPDAIYTFDKFIVGSSNKFAHAAGVAVSKNPGKSYNPLFIYGQSGLGKTHLLYSISTVIKQNINDAKIIYIKGEDFTNELVSAIGDGSVSNFRNKYRMADLLLVDDIQFVAGKERTQEEFFHTFNALYESNKQIVLTSDRPPKEINTLEDRLKTRFEWGLLADIQPPDYETRLAILRAKAKFFEIDIPDDIIEYIARTITSNVRQLEGTVKKLTALNSLMGLKINKELAAEAISDIFKESPGLNPTPELIIKHVCTFYNISSDKLSSSNRSKETVQPRQIAMYLVRELTKYSLPEIGKVFSRDHSTVLHSVNKIEDYLKDSSSEMYKIINTITDNIRNS